MLSVSAAVPRLDVRVLLCDAPPTHASLLQFSSREHYAAAADELNRIAIPTPRLCHLQTLNGRLPLDLQMLRSAVAFGFRKPASEERVTLARVTAALANPAKRLAAERLLAAYGYLSTVGGVQHISDAPVDRPCFWPKARRARAAVLLWLLVTARRGELPDQLHLVAP